MVRIVAVFVVVAVEAAVVEKVAEVAVLAVLVDILLLVGHILHSFGNSLPLHFDTLPHS